MISEIMSQAMMPALLPRADDGDESDESIGLGQEVVARVSNAMKLTDGERSLKLRTQGIRPE